MLRGRRKTQKAGKGGTVSWFVFFVVGVLGPTAAVWGGVWVYHYFKNNFTEPEAGRVAEVYNVALQLAR